MSVQDDLLVTPDVFRRAMGQFATGITIVTSISQGSPVGMTANSFTSVSLRPCLLLVCVKACSITGAAIRSHKAFGISLLTENQEALALDFSRPSADRFRGVDFDLADFQVPIIRDCVASFICALHEIHLAGDHEIIVGRVTEIAHAVDAKPLVYLGGKFGCHIPRSEPRL